MPTEAGPGGVLYNVAPPDGGLGTLFAPDNLSKIMDLQAKTAFANGLPTDAAGNPDFGAMANSLIQKGDLANGSKLLELGINQRALAAAQQNAAAVGTFPGAAPASPDASPAAPAPAAAPSVQGAKPEVVSYVRDAFARRGVNPNMGVAVGMAEGLRGFDPAGNANPGDAGSSFGPFQLHYGGVASGSNAGAGLGDDYTKATGLNARDPSTWKQQVDYVADYVAKHGWGPWSGARKLGITGMMGVGQAPSPGAAAAPSSSAAGAAPQPVGGPAQPDAPPSDGIPKTPARAASAAGDDETMMQPVGSHPYGGQPAASPPPVRIAAAGPITLPSPGQGSPAAPAPAAGGGTAPMPTSPTSPPPAMVAAAGSAPQPLDPTYGGQVPAAWLKAGHNAGEWVNYARAQAAMNAALPGGYGKGSAEAWGKIADGLSSSIDKSMTFTPEQKNARDPVALGYEQRKVDYANQSRIAADNSPEAIRGAGQKAAAEAQGRAETENANTLVPVAMPDGSMQMTTRGQALNQAAAGNGPLQSLPGYITSGQKALATKLNDGTAAFQERQIAGQRLDTLGNLLSSFTTGANSQAFNDAAAKARSLGITIPDSATVNPAAMQEFVKQGYASVLSSMKELGNKQFVSEVQSAIKSNPNPDLQPEANAALIAQMQGVRQYHDANHQAFVSWYNDPTNRGAANDAQFQIGWAKGNPVQPFVDAARKNIAPLGMALPSKARLVDGQVYMVKGPGGQPVRARWNAAGNGFAPVPAGP